MNLKVAVVHNGADSSVQYANQLNERLEVDTTILDVHDPRPVRLALPLRAVPSVAVLLIPDSMEEADMEDILHKLDLIRNLDEVDQLIHDLAESPGKLSKAQQSTIQNLTKVTMEESTVIPEDGAIKSGAQKLGGD